jgi:hypothetical protein
VPTEPDRVTERELVRGRAVRRVLLAVLVAFVLAGVTGLLGPKTATATATANGYTFAVTYPEVTRPGLPVRWEFVAAHAGGFSGPVTITFPLDYLHFFDLTNIEPDAEASVAGRDEIAYRFPRPAGEAFRVSFDATAEADYRSLPPVTAWLADGGRRVVGVTYSTRMMP